MPLARLSPAGYQDDLGRQWQETLPQDNAGWMKYLIHDTLSIVLFLFKAHDVSETEFRLRHQVEPTQLGELVIASPCLRLHSVSVCSWKLLS
jgi:hypothetical protein